MAKKEWLVVVWNDGSGQFSIERLAATEEEIKEAYELVGEELTGIIRKALFNIRDYHERQRQNSW